MAKSDRVQSENNSFSKKGIGDRFIEILFGEKGLFKGNRTAPKLDPNNLASPQPILINGSYEEGTISNTQLLPDQTGILNRKNVNPSGQLLTSGSHDSTSCGPMIAGQKIPPAPHSRETAKVKPPRLVTIDDFPRSQSLTLSQKQWYGYWKGEVQNNQFPVTHLGYINLFAEESLERRGSKLDNRTISLVVAMWKNYRTTFPNLDYYLIPKIAQAYDASRRHDLAYGFWMEIFQNRQIGQIWSAYPYLNAILQKALDDGKLSELPFGVWVQLCGRWASVGTNKFYENQNAHGEYDAVFIRAIMGVDAYCLKKYKKPLILRNNRRGKPQKAMGITYYYDFCSATGMITTVAAIIRFTENLLRKKMNMRLIKVDEALLNQDIKDAIVGSMISYDPSRVSRILDESKELADRLAPPPEDESAFEDQRPLQAPLFHPSFVETAMLEPQKDASASDPEVWSKFVQNLAPLAKNVLSSILKEGGTIPQNQVEGFARQHGKMAETLIDSINEQALETTGLLILYNEGDQWMIEEEAADHLRTVLITEEK